ncbi:CHAP domain-containing protein [Clostridium sp.]|uniref:CHAP domain-containing protein n=1 Tax=Clostridium sp. TaxID=1506 RepID=UPI00284DA3E6|nr:CHAP domain-containing protein [Clostridium sp.]MDR3596174.1 CHAP domain-containing protein [Clostridium sp.]
MKREFLKKIIVIGMATLIITSMHTISASAKWIEDSQDNWNWIEDGTKAVGWKAVDGNWYYFNNDGTMYTGWLKDNGIWYSLSSGGQMNTGWKLINGKWYYFNNDGTMYAGWLKDNGNWYNLSSSGQMSVGWINDNGIEYFTNSNGEMQTGTVTIDGKVYNFSDSGAMLDSDYVNQEKRPDLGNETKVNDAMHSNIGYVSTNSDSLNVRSDATLSSDIIGSIANGAEVTIIDDEKNGFYPILLSGKKGWVSSQWISLEGSDNTSTETIVNPLVANSDNTSTKTIVNPLVVNSYNSVNTTALTINNESQKVSLVKLGPARDTEPSLDNKYYYSDGNLFYKIKLSPPFSDGEKVIKGNCTWYAWGRAWEITGNKPTDAGFVGDAYEWWEANKNSGKYQCGSEPRVGAIAVWRSDLPGSGGCGHVAVVENIQNGSIYISESTWDGGTFNYKEIYDTNYLYGYIYLDEPNY